MQAFREVKACRPNMTPTQRENEQLAVTSARSHRQRGGQEGLQKAIEIPPENWERIKLDDPEENEQSRKVIQKWQK